MHASARACARCMQDAWRGTRSFARGAPPGVASAASAWAAEARIAAALRPSMTSKYEDENARALESADQLSADWLTSALLHCGVLQVRPRMRSIAPFVFAFVDAD
mgnify:CR=1 FL=1